MLVNASVTCNLKSRNKINSNHYAIQTLHEIKYINNITYKTFSNTIIKWLNIKKHKDQFTKLSIKSNDIIKIIVKQ